MKSKIEGLINDVEQGKQKFTDIVGQKQAQRAENNTSITMSTKQKINRAREIQNEKEKINKAVK